MKLVTRGEKKRKACIDYITGVLLYNNVTYLHRLLAAPIMEVRERERLAHLVDSAQEYLRFLYATHIAKNRDFTHDKDFAVLCPLPHEEGDRH